MYYLRTEHSFDSAHFLKDYEGKCRNIHGHRWKVIVEIAKQDLETDGNRRGMIVDFSEIKDRLKSICDEFDHCLICEKGSLKSKTIEALLEENFRMIETDFIPTAENFAKYFYDRIKAEGFLVHRVEVHETPNNYAAYEE